MALSGKIYSSCKSNDDPMQSFSASVFTYRDTTGRFIKKIVKAVVFPYSLPQLPTAWGSFMHSATNTRVWSTIHPHPRWHNYNDEAFWKHPIIRREPSVHAHKKSIQFYCTAQTIPPITINHKIRKSIILKSMMLFNRGDSIFLNFFWYIFYYQLQQQ